ncbi:hypothetical protein [Methanoplanus endosymbiosus]|uniref:Uncharacterized protein n=1 Tax=Methanoplanus endosymbiosus TaxID=33865 RepID=A0A9E7PSH0_9EURY|nr:hypothetical protein [Methanoplanus endosymbiosus]UUX92887.1 hypothetical protein L6E24_01795 [Methanoplanus endosymbiosus]
MIETNFGWIRINGETFEYDIVIHTDGSITRRNRKGSKKLKGIYGHTPLTSDELEFLREERPEVVYVGTGQNGALPITPDAEEILADYRAVIGTTPEIIPEIKVETRKYSAIIHVTC